MNGAKAISKYGFLVLALLLTASFLLLPGCKGNQTTQTTTVTTGGTSNNAPSITSFSANPSSLSAGGTSTITVSASDSDGDTLSYTWSVTCGSVSGTGSSVTYTAPSSAGSCTISVTVSDGKTSTTGSASVTVTSTSGGNNPPSISSVSVASSTLTPGQSTTATVSASDADNDTLSYSWSATGGTISGTSSSVTYTSPSTAGTYTISVTVSDGKGGNVTGSASVTVTSNTGGVKYNETFSSSPVFTFATTPQTGDSYTWDSALGIYKVLLAETSSTVNKYALSPTFTKVSNTDFVIQVDLKPVKVSFGMGIGIKFYDADLGLDKAIEIHHTGSDNPLFSISDLTANTYRSTAPTLGTWYTIRISYIKSTGKADLKITNTSTGQVFYQQNAVTFNPTSFNRVAFGAVTGSGDGSTAEMHYDNVLIQ